jgi:acetylornithine deacetylase
MTPREMIERLIAFDTTSAKSNLELIEFVEDYLAGLGVASLRFSNPEGTKANLFATLGPEVPGGVVLSGHSDVVPVAGQAWESDPFQVIERDGRVFGRGVADMKSFIAIALALAPRFLSAPLKKPVHLAISYDEEVGCLGVGSMIDGLEKVAPRPRIVLVGEPTMMKVVNAHKGVFVFRTTIEGREAHSSLPHLGASASLAAARLGTAIAEMAAEKKASALPDCPFEPPYTSFNLGVIEAGTAVNIIPNRASLSWEFRLLPGDDPAAITERFQRTVEEEVLPYLRETHPGASIVTEALATVPPLEPERHGAAEELARRLSGSNATEVVAYGTEGGHFQQAGLSVVVCGPGSIEQAHKPNEFIDLEQVAACETFLGKLCDWLCSEEALA